MLRARPAIARLARLTPLAPLLLWVLLTGCGHSRRGAAAADTPVQALSRYRDALERNDARAAYALLAEPLRQALPLSAFQQQWDESATERAAQAAALGSALRGAAPGLSQQAVVTLSSGTQLVLAAEPGTGAGAGAGTGVVTAAPSWRVVDPDLSRVRADTPEAALKLLLDAVDQRSFPAMLRLLAPAERQLIEAEIRERAEKLRAVLSRGLANLAEPGAGPEGAQATETGATRRPGTTTPAPPTLPPSTTRPGLTFSRDARGERMRLQYDPRFFIELQRVPPIPGTPGTLVTADTPAPARPSPGPAASASASTAPGPPSATSTSTPPPTSAPPPAPPRPAAKPPAGGSWRIADFN